MTPTADPVARALLAAIALALGWQALRPHVMPAAAEAARDTVTVNLERIAGHYLTGGAIPIRCADLPGARTR